MSEWKYTKNELPPLNTTVLCFTGGRRFGAYELGSMVEDSTGAAEWHMEGRPSEYVIPLAWQLLPDAPDFMEFI